MYKNRPINRRRQFAKPTAVAGVVLAFAMVLSPVPAQAAGGAARIAEYPIAADLARLDSASDFIEAASTYSVDIHELYFSLRPYEGTKSCVMCHEREALESLDMGHFKWSGTVDNIVGLEGQQVGKRDLLNNFCVAVPSNEGRCTQCHAGLGYADAGFDFNDPLNVDCLVCHDQSGTYEKGLKSAGLPADGVDLGAVARSITIGGKPKRKACIGCHAKAGGGDNVKHGDLSTDLISTTREFDVHMGVDGANMDCVDCHAANHDPKTGEVNHGIAGMSLHSVYEGEMRQCADCHGSRESIHAGSTAEDIFAEDRHDRLACQSCHIPAIARVKPTKVEWYWSEAGETVNPTPIDPETGMNTYDKKKGRFVWKNNVRPMLLWSNGKWNRKVIGLTDTYEEVPIDLGSPVGDYDDPTAMIYPFKLMIGNQPVDPVTKTVLVPHLFGPAGGENPYWSKWDWAKALEDGTAYAGQEFSGTFEFTATEMLLSVNHEIAPAENALGFGGINEGGCLDCHDSDVLDWQKLGWSKNPLDGGRRAGKLTVTPAVVDRLTRNRSD